MRPERLTLFVLLFAMFIAPLTSTAQNNAFARVGQETDIIQSVCSPGNYCPNIYTGTTTKMSIIDTSMYANYPNYPITDTCMVPFNWRIVPSDTPFGTASGTDISKFPTLRGGPSGPSTPRTFYVRFDNWIYFQHFEYQVNGNNAPIQGMFWRISVDGSNQVTPARVFPQPDNVVQYAGQSSDNYPIYRFKGTLKVNIWGWVADTRNTPNHTREFALSPGIVWAPWSIYPERVGFSGKQIRFKAVVLGSWLEPGTPSGQYGRFKTPEVPVSILRDPPGDKSYGFIEQGSETCTGQTFSASVGTESSGFGRVRVGVAGSFGIIVSVPFEVYGQVEVDGSAETTETSDKEYKTCFSAASLITTPQSGPPDDVFRVSSMQYEYGFGTIIKRSGCVTPQKTTDFIVNPVAVLSENVYPESFVRNTLVPLYQDSIANTPEADSTDFRRYTEQLSVWQQVLASNDAMKANPPSDGAVQTSIVGAGAVQHTTYTTTTDSSTTLEYNVYLDKGVSTEFGASIAGSGVWVGGGIRWRQDIGSSESSSNSTTNSVGYHLEDDDEGDFFNMQVRKDNVNGTNVYYLLPNGSPATESSWPYEGGYQRDQPKLWVGAMNSVQMVQTEVTTTAANFPVFMCNTSNEARQYHLKVDNLTNPDAAILEVAGVNLSQEPGYAITVPANSCPQSTVALTQPVTPTTTDYENVVLTFYAFNDTVIKSNVTISAYFGTGNTNSGVYCVPVYPTNSATSDFIDAVKLGTIDNDHSGGFAGESYVDYYEQFDTDLSRSGQYMLTVISGTWVPDRFAAWIDYDHDQVFEANEKLGEFNNSAAYQPNNISFTVPADALTGATRMRVRCIDPQSDPFQSVDPCAYYQYGETEDYQVIINANTPVDCQNTPNGTALPGSPCNDGNAATGGDSWNANCACIGQPLDCDGTINGTAVAGTACDDGDPTTGTDTWTTGCVCVGLVIDCEQLPGGQSLPGTACDDNDATTGNDTWNANCTCAGLFIDCDGIPGGTLLEGTPCDDGNQLSTDDVINTGCICAGTLTIDCEGVSGGEAQPGTACNDGDSNTGADVFGPNCICAGQPLDCAGVPGGTAVVGAPCDDQDADTFDDLVGSDCICLGTYVVDCEGTSGGTAQPGTICDDGNADTPVDVWNTFCDCVGLLPDCEGTLGGSAVPGAPCNDWLEDTGLDTWNANCVCAGLPLDCDDEPGGSLLPGTPCDDGNMDTDNDIINLDCDCYGTLANDCAGVAGGPAQPGTPCDDGNANTGEDVYDAGCTCAGQPLDCAGVLNGVDLPGGICNDNQDCTASDVWSTECVCSGTPVTIGNVSGSTLVIGLTSNAYFVTPVAGATSYEWTLPNGWTTNDNSAFVLVAEANNTPGPVELCVTATVGACEVTSCITLTVDFNTGVITPAANTSECFTVQPNPSNGVFQLNPIGGDAPMTITVYDGTGRTVKAQFPVAGKRTVSLDLGEVAPGAYYLMATMPSAGGHREGQTRAVKIMVER